MDIIENVFDMLFENNICFSVLVADSALRLGESLGSDNYLFKDYYVIIKNTNKNNISCTEFEVCEENSKLLYYCLTFNEIKQFKKMKSKFIKVKHNEFGRVYELKDYRFNEFYNKLNVML